MEVVNYVHLEPAKVPEHLRGTYTGKKFRAVACERYMVPPNAGQWDGGSKDAYFTVNLKTGKIIQAFGPFIRGRERETEVTLTPGVVLVRDTIFMGKRHGLTFMVHPKDIAPLMNGLEPELNKAEKQVLWATRVFKASHGDKTRYDMLVDEMGGIAPFSREKWDELRAGLREKGLMNKAYALTVAGKNVAHKLTWWGIR